MPATVNLKPVLQAIERLGANIDGLVRVVRAVKPAESEPIEWTFDIKRNQAGFMRSVDVKPKLRSVK